MVESAGLVIIYDNKILLGHPKGQSWYGSYSIPKGHLEKGEDHLTAAIRETQEELGIKIGSEQINTNEEEYINYKDENGEIYKRVYYFVVELDEPIEIDKTKLQKDEIDWAGFLTKEEAEKRIFWRFKPLLKYLDKLMKKKMVKESLNEAISFNDTKYSVAAFDWNADGDEVRDTFANALREFGLHLVPDPGSEGSDMYVFIITDKELSPKELDKISKQVNHEDFEDE